ncbi:MAG: hypothetical protein NT140_12265 [Deltaproteobacteria bacterium]|nr:hypothetical protein [Deltaproteobacteria bacterium]
MKKIQIGIIGGTRDMGKWFADYLTAQGYRGVAARRQPSLAVGARQAVPRFKARISLI